MSEENERYERIELDDFLNPQQEDKENLVQEALQKQRELEQLNLNPEEILEDEDKSNLYIRVELTP